MLYENISFPVIALTFRVDSEKLNECKYETIIYEKSY